MKVLVISPEFPQIQFSITVVGEWWETVTDTVVVIPVDFLKEIGKSQIKREAFYGEEIKKSQKSNPMSNPPYPSYSNANHHSHIPYNNPPNEPRQIPYNNAPLQIPYNEVPASSIPYNDPPPSAYLARRPPSEFSQSFYASPSPNSVPPSEFAQSFYETRTLPMYTNSATISPAIVHQKKSGRNLCYITSCILIIMMVIMGVVVLSWVIYSRRKSL